MQKILQMLQLQQQLNDNTNGKEWEKGITKNGKIIDWKRCAYLECAELIESYPWKHWKSIDASPDYENIKIERDYKKCINLSKNTRVGRNR